MSQPSSDELGRVPHPGTNGRRLDLGCLPSSFYFMCGRVGASRTSPCVPSGLYFSLSLRVRLKCIADRLGRHRVVNRRNAYEGAPQRLPQAPAEEIPGGSGPIVPPKSVNSRGQYQKEENAPAAANTECF
jgi:hypothetical protein